MKLRNKLRKSLYLCVSYVVLLCSCGENTPEEVEYVYDFHKQYSPTYQYPLVADSLDLYMDYTDGITMKRRVKFFWEVLKPICADKAERYYAIKGDDISLEAGNVGELINGISNHENPNLKGALDKIVNSNKESILITDAELVNPSDPFMKDAFKTWLLKGHDVFFMVEPYLEGTVQKKMFYLVFYDSKMDNNIMDYIKRVGKIDHYPKIFKMNLSTLAFLKGTHGGHSDPNSFVQAMVTRKGDMELQEWSTEWEDKIEKYIVNIKDRKGNDLKESAVLIDGLQLDRASIGGVRVSGIQMKVFNINGEYTDYYKAKKAELPLETETLDLDEYEHFIVMDEDVFERNSVIKLYFDRVNYDTSILDGDPYNYFKICFYVKEIEERMESIKDYLVFDDRFKKGYKNVSMFESVKQTLEDKDVIEFIANNPFYTIYVKSLKH